MRPSNVLSFCVDFSTSPAQIKMYSNNPPPPVPQAGRGVAMNSMNGMNLSAPVWVPTAVTAVGTGQVEYAEVEKMVEVNYKGNQFHVCMSILFLHPNPLLQHNCIYNLRMDANLGDKIHFQLALPLFYLLYRYRLFFLFLLNMDENENYIPFE